MSEHSEHVAIEVVNVIADVKDSGAGPYTAIVGALQIAGMIVVELAHIEDRLEDIFCTVDRMRT